MKHSALYTVLATLLLALTACNDDTPAPPTPLVPPKEIHKIDYDSDHVYHLGDDLKIGGMGGCLAYQAILYKQKDGKYAVALQNVCDLADFKEAGLTGTIEQDVVPGAKSIILSTVPEEETCQIFGEGDTSLVTYSISGEIHYDDELKKHIMHLKSDVKLKDSQNVMPIIAMDSWWKVNKNIIITNADKQLSIGDKTINSELLFNKILNTPFIYAGNYGEKDFDNQGNWVIINKNKLSINNVISILSNRIWLLPATGFFSIHQKVCTPSTSYNGYKLFYPISGFCSSVKTSENFEDIYSDGNNTIKTYTGNITLFPSLISLQNNESPIDISDGLKKIIQLIRVNFYKYCISSKMYVNGLKLDAIYSDEYYFSTNSYHEQDDSYSKVSFQKIKTRYIEDYTYTLHLTPNLATGIAIFKEVLYPILSDPSNIKAISNTLANDSELGLTAQEIENFILSMPGLATESNNFQLKFYESVITTSPALIH